jgi:hypothetical protein
MALYTVSPKRTLSLTKHIAVRAKNEEAAEAKAEEMIAQGAFCTLAWQVTAPNVLDWQEEDEIEIDVVQEE